MKEIVHSAAAGGLFGLHGADFGHVSGEGAKDQDTNIGLINLRPPIPPPTDGLFESG